MEALPALAPPVPHTTPGQGPGMEALPALAPPASYRTPPRWPGMEALPAPAHRSLTSLQFPMTLSSTPG